MSLRYALLGLLAEEPASGYDLAGKFERNLRRYAWHAQRSQIYPELNRLAADGLVSVVEEGARGRRAYAITDVGRIELRRWVLDPNDEPVVRNEHTLKLFLLATLDVEDARKVLRQQAEGACTSTSGSGRRSTRPTRAGGRPSSSSPPSSARGTS
ncbi:PadR family transcriptional regulator [Dactylosporangium darangshiense]|uniref:PadR family transcriptional regulator n=1 Tax=Dactylosporangium darangshiense TaxID=579108 RepID=UPI003625E4BF